MHARAVPELPHRCWGYAEACVKKLLLEVVVGCGGGGVIQLPPASAQSSPHRSLIPECPSLPLPSNPAERSAIKNSGTPNSILRGG